MRWILIGLCLAIGCSGGNEEPEETGTEETGSADTGGEETGDTEAQPCGASTTQVALETTLGTIVVALEREKAPITTENFIAYVDAGFYDGTDGDGATIFHRVISGFMIQGGGHRSDLSQKDTLPPIVNESTNGLSNTRGTIAMARTNAPDSATSQFFINHVDNAFLDLDGSYPPGYAVFGSVSEGLDIVDAIAAVPTGSMNGYQDVPQSEITILAANCR